ncbi:MAG: sporulation protein YunB [Candidatus Syntrophonatronum acetioxidans]|uniref:Sporulation protein YunB n=1 Tax=Candidatus Syntrophonatronum acetioxidans TaxID=1795816 RepID=A0A424YGV7_9FIRM|nr:MAG: sporulation protein YunB [Candidatus Syntrophonatronum acetioxidans]
MAGFLIAALMLFLVGKFLSHMEQNLRPTIISAALYYTDMLATEAINEAVREEVAESMSYENLVQIEKDRQGRIVMARVNTREVNRIMSVTTLKVQETLRSMEGEVIKLPLGQALGSYILANLGPKIPIVMVPLGRVNTSIDDVFEEAGINQTRHKLYFNINAQVQILIPFIASRTEVVTQVPLAEFIYQGEVPDTVINLQFPGN